MVNFIRWLLFDRRNKSLRLVDYIIHGRDDYSEFSGCRKPFELCPCCRLKDLFCPVCGKQKKPCPDGLWVDSWWVCGYACSQKIANGETIRKLPADVYCRKHREALERLYGKHI